MAFFHHDEKQEPTTAAQSPLSGDNTVAEWLDHPIGGAIFRDMLMKAGQNENVLRIVRKVSMNRLIQMSRGQFTQEMLDDMVRKANAGQLPQPDSEIQPEVTSTSQSTEPEHTPAPSLPAESPAAEQSTPSIATPEETQTKSIIEDTSVWKEQITPERFRNKTVIVTGAGSGIGRATALRVASEGGRVIAVDISKERLDELTHEVPDTSITMTVVVGDITDDTTVQAVINAAGGSVDALANIAGIMDNMTPLHEMTDEIWDKVMNVNLRGMMKLSRAVLPLMLEKHKGTIVNVGSEASLKASAAGAAYTTSKHAVVGLSKSMAFMYGPSGIRTNVVAPGAVLTNIEATFDSKLGEERVNSLLPTAPEAAEAPELAASITFLLSDDSVNINGAVLPSDNGWSVQ